MSSFSQSSTPKFDFLILVDDHSKSVKILKSIFSLLFLPENKETLKSLKSHNNIIKSLDLPCIYVDGPHSTFEALTTLFSGESTIDTGQKPGFPIHKARDHTQEF